MMAQTSEEHMADELLVVENLEKHFPVRRGIVFQKEIARVKAVDGVSFAVRTGETLGVVGESGCGKSTIGPLRDAAAGAHRRHHRASTARTSPASAAASCCTCAAQMQMVFQDPYASLNPRKRVGYDRRRAAGGAQDRHPGRDAKRACASCWKWSACNPEHYNRFPHEFSGGQRQRIGIARALALRPKLIVCDEPVSALDVSVQAQVLNLLKRLQREFGLTYVFIAHDLDVVKHISDRVAVMYLGKMVEMGRPGHLPAAAAPVHGRAAFGGADPRPGGRPRSADRWCSRATCPARSTRPRAAASTPRCPRFQSGTCDIDEPPLEAKGSEGNHQAACHFPLESWPLTDLRLPSQVASGA